MSSLSVDLGRLQLNNPLVPASGTFFSLDRLPENYPLDALGAYLTKTITLHERLGNPQPRIKECSSAILNSIGLENKGWKHFEKEKLPDLLDLKTQRWISIAGSKVEEYAELCRLINPYDVDLIEINVSCPNVKEGGVQFCQHISSLREVLHQCRKYSRHFLLVKISIETSSFHEAIKTILDEGADAVCIGNTLQGLSIDIHHARPFFKNIMAGYSGPAIKPLALRRVWEARKYAPILPIVGCGGISNYEDVIEFLMAGAQVVEIGTAHFLNPMIIPQIKEDLHQYCTNKNCILSGLINIAHQEA